MLRAVEKEEEKLSKLLMASQELQQKTIQKYTDKEKLEMFAEKPQRNKEKQQLSEMEQRIKNLLKLLEVYEQQTDSQQILKKWREMVYRLQLDQFILDQKLKLEQKQQRDQQAEFINNKKQIELQLETVQQKYHLLSSESQKLQKQLQQSKQENQKLESENQNLISKNSKLEKEVYKILSKLDSYSNSFQKQMKTFQKQIFDSFWQMSQRIYFLQDRLSILQEYKKSKPIHQIQEDVSEDQKELLNPFLNQIQDRDKLIQKLQAQISQLKYEIHLLKQKEKLSTVSTLTNGNIQPITSSTNVIDMTAKPQKESLSKDWRKFIYDYYRWPNEENPGTKTVNPSNTKNTKIKLNTNL